MTGSTPFPGSGTAPARGRFSPGIRLKLIAFLLPLLVLTIAGVAAAVLTITEGTVRRDLLQRGVAISRVVALSASHSLLSGDQLALHSLTAETKDSSAEIEYVAVRDTNDRILAHSRVELRGAAFTPPGRAADLGRFNETRAEDVVREGRSLIEFTTPIFFAGKRVGTISLALSQQSLLSAQQGVRRSILLVAAASLGVALLGMLILASLITTPVKHLTSGIGELANGKAFHPIPVRSGDELGELTRSFNRMAETILDQQGRLRRYAQELEEAYIGLVRVIAASIDARDPYTLGHSTRVARLSRELGKRIGLPEEEIDHLEKACLFHDVGKIRTPDEVLLKGEMLEAREMEVMRSHPSDGGEILGLAPSLRRYIPVVLYHHEWYDGSGYPEGRRGSEIPLHARIIALADAYDAMTTTRPYRNALTTEEAVEEILAYRGSQFSPELTDTFVRMIRELPSIDASDLKGMAL